MAKQISLLALAALATAAPFTTSDADGFPNPNADQLKQISLQADGLLSNAPPPAKLNDSTIPLFQAIAVNEIFEVAFFESLLWNITNQVPGFESWDEASQQAREKVLKVVVAQEELHALNAINVVKHFNKTVPQPCKYVFPSIDVQGAFGFASTFTSLVLGTLQDVIQAAAVNGDAAVSRAVSAVVGQEGEQNGYYRTLLNLVPSEKPFLTTNLGPFGFSWINNIVTVPGSCPYDVSSIPIPIFPPLFVQGTATGLVVDAADQALQFTADLSECGDAKSYIGGDGKGLYVTYFNGALLPISVPAENVKWDGGHVTLDANFPFTDNEMFGLTVAAITTGANFSNPDAVAAKTLAAPALIEVNDCL